jgi:flavin-dependent dehydrogenase
MPTTDGAVSLRDAHFDVVVCGAGPAGAAYAYAAARAGANVLLAGPPPRHHTFTLEVIHGRARERLEELGLLATVVDGAAPCAGVVGTWGAAGPMDRPALLEPYGGGWIVDRASLDARLVVAAHDAGATRIEAVVQSVEPIESAVSGETGASPLLPGVGAIVNRWRVRTASNSYRCSRVVIATGRTGRLLDRCGARRKVRHRLVAAVGWVKSTRHDLGDRLRVDATPCGWWFRIGGIAGTAAGFLCDTDLLRPGRNRAAATWIHAVGHLGWPDARHVEPRLRPAFITLPPETPVGMQVVGDAALAVDPLSGHGLTLAFESVSRVLADQARYQEWLADTAVLHQRREREIYTATGYSGRFWRRRSYL